MYPLYYFYIGVGKNDGTAGGSAAAAANGLTTKGPYITSANFSFQNNIPGGARLPDRRGRASTTSCAWRLRAAD